jgi:hypothetical protein
MPIKLKKKRKPYRPHCKICRQRMMAKDYCRWCKRNTCGDCEINHVCPDLPHDVG